MLSSKNQKTPPASAPTSDLVKASVAAEKLYREALEKGDEALARTVLEVCRLFVPNVRFSGAGLRAARVPHPSPKVSLEATEQPADLSAGDEDERDYRFFTDQIDGTAIRRRVAEEAIENEAITERYYRENPENAPTNWSPERGYGD